MFYIDFGDSLLGILSSRLYFERLMYLCVELTDVKLIDLIGTPSLGMKDVGARYPYCFLFGALSVVCTCC